VLEALEDPEASYVSPYQRATVYEALGDRETALRCLEEAILPRDAWLVWIDVDPMLDGLRGEPRYAAVRARVMKP